MITEQAIVTRCDGKQAEVEFQRASVCGHCELEQGCGTGAIGRLLGHRSKPLVIETEQNLQPGDQVLLGMSESVLVKASLMIYGLPLIGMMLVGSLVYRLSAAPEWLVVVAAGAGFFAGFKIATYLTRALAQNRLSPVIVDIRVNPVR